MQALEFEAMGRSLQLRLVRRATLRLSLAVLLLLAVVFSPTSSVLHCFFGSYTGSACSAKKMGIDIWLL